MDIHDYLKPQKLGWLHFDHADVNLDLFSWGIALDPAGVMVAGIFAGRKTALDEVHLLLDARFTIRMQAEDIAFSGYGSGAYQKFDQELPNGQGLARLYLHRGATSDDPLEIGGMLFFYVWGATPEAPDFELWAARMQDVHRMPVRKSWYPQLWQILVARGWAQPCRTYGFGCLWEVSVTSEEWQAMILENLTALERRPNGTTA